MVINRRVVPSTARIGAIFAGMPGGPSSGGLLAPGVGIGQVLFAIAYRIAVRLKAVLLHQLDQPEALAPPVLLRRRYRRLRGYGASWTA